VCFVKSWLITFTITPTAEIAVGGDVLPLIVTSRHATTTRVLTAER
jgi:hypothetical protein